MGELSLEDQIKEINKKLSAIIAFFSISTDQKKSSRNVFELSLRAKRSAELRRVKEGDRAGKR